MRAGGWFIRTAVVVVTVVLIAPTIIVVVASFSAGRNIQFPPPALSLDAYAKVLGDPAVWDALRNSVWIAIIAVVVSTVCGVPAALALDDRRRLRGGGALRSVLTIGIATPIIVSATGFLLVFTALRTSGNLTSVGYAIAAINLPLVLFTVTAALARLNPELEEAASTLGAEEVQQMLFVKLPQIASGIITGALLVFVLTLTDFVISIMLTTSADTTLPVYIYSGLQVTVSPALGAISTLYIAVVGVVFIAVLRMGGVDQYVRRPFQ